MTHVTIPTFDYEELNGKHLKIYVSKNIDGTTVVGVDEDDDTMYVLHQEINVEKPFILRSESMPMIFPEKDKRKRWR